MTGTRRFSGAQAALLGLAAWLAWQPAETHPWSAMLTTAVVFALSPWGWRRTPAALARSCVGAGVVFALLIAAGLSGWDPASAVTELALLAAVAGLVWLASREAPPDSFPTLLALLVSGLALWGLWQVFVGFEEAIPQVADLPAPMRSAAAERLASGRAFASQILPSHLAVLLATALPLLLARIRWRLSAAPWVVASVLCAAGVILTRSPVGIGLALAGSAALALARRRSWMVVATVALGIALVAVVLARGDVRDLEPVGLRFDNWRSALWVWSTAPAAGVGPGGFAQAAQAVPFTVGNRPRHAHSLPLEWLAELGPAGFLAFAVLALALWRLVRTLWPQHPELAIAIVVIPIHNLADFSFYGSGVAVPWAVLLGWSMAQRRGDPVADTAPAGRVVVVLIATLALALSSLHAVSRTVGESAAFRASPEGRVTGAFEAHRIAPWRVEPLGLAATSALQSGDQTLISAVAEELDHARWLRPRSAALAALSARLRATLGEAPSAVSEAWCARREQPRDTEKAKLLNDLALELEGGAKGADR